MRLNQAIAGQVWREMTLLSLMSNRSSSKKLKGNKSRGNDCYNDSTISRDKKACLQNQQDMKESKKIINNCKENDQEELRRILKLKKTRTAPRAMIKGQSNEAILMGMRMHNSNRSHTNEESTVSDDGITTSSNMSGTNEGSIVSEDNSQGGNNTPSMSDIHQTGCTQLVRHPQAGCTSPHFTAQQETKMDQSRSKSFETIQRSFISRQSRSQQMHASAQKHRYSKREQKTKHASIPTIHKST
jgi:hypothetical protein